MTFFVAIFLGLIQGLTEFLPVSSSGHLVLFQQIFNVNCNAVLFDVILHLGTLLAVIIIYRKQLLNIIKNPFSNYAINLYMATLPTLIIALLFKDFFEASFSGNLLFLGFFITAIFMFIADYVSKKSYQYKSLNSFSSGVMGVFQGLAILPGISRSGSTITSAIVQGVKRDEAAEFSFLMSFPIILCSAVYEIISTPIVGSGVPVVCLLAGFIASFIAGVLSIKLMIKVIKKAKFIYFGVYMILLSAIVFCNQFIFNWF